MYSNKLYSPLRYPGGKVRFAPLIAGVMRASQLEGGHYLEPYAGGAGVALALLFDGVVEQAHINDFDPAVAVFWRVATKQSDALIELVANAPVDMDAWYHWRSVMNGQQPATDLERAFATLFLNRTNRSGILKGGVIGGKSQSGEYKLDARFMRQEICSRLERIGKHAKCLHVYEEDAFSLLLRCHQFLPLRSMVYLDPPYYVKGAGLYRNFYKHEDHAKIAKLLGSPKFRRPWIVSYDDAPEIRSMYIYARSYCYGLNYTAQRRYKGAEVMFFSDRLQPCDEVECDQMALELA
ncbi:DNA adenine methylase [Achromobacter ruhlandii]|uniref:DNA adenine methylase n=1 Tax=Achromobacter ruhlandii TaxID=72557 RepID=UPI0007BEE583|nr:DNA adenine methylase [Achromobacter ruhlandii]